MTRLGAIAVFATCLFACGPYGLYRPVLREVPRAELEGTWIATSASLRAAEAAEPSYASPPVGGRFALQPDGGCTYESFLSVAPRKIVWLQGSTTPCHWEIAIARSERGPREVGARYLVVTLRYPTVDAIAGFELELNDTTEGIVIGQSTIDPDDGPTWLLYERRAG
jgi:hypothetical protein